MKQCLICKDYIEDTVTKCGKCGATQPPSSVTLPPRQARFSFTAVPRKWFPGAPIHALLFADNDIHDMLLKPISDDTSVAGTLLLGGAMMDGIDAHAARRLWPQVKALPMSQLAAQFQLARNLPYKSLAWIGVDKMIGGARLILALNSGRFVTYMMGKQFGSPPAEDVVTGLNNILYPKVTWALDYKIPDKLYEE